MGRERKRGAGPMEGCFKVTHLLNDRNRRRKISDGDFNTSPRGFSCPPPLLFHVNGHIVRPSFLFN